MIKIDSIFMRLLFLMILCVLSVESVACICETIPFEKEYISSDVIVIAEIVDSDTASYQINVIEYLKGNGEEILEGRIDASCSIYPRRGEYWLIYAIYDNGFILATTCGSSRSFSSFFTTNGYKREPAPNGMTEAQYYLSNDMVYNIELSEFHFEINTMRHRRMEGLLNSFLLENGNAQKYFEINRILYWSIGVVVFLNLVILLTLFRLSKRNS